MDNELLSRLVSDLAPSGPAEPTPRRLSSALVSLGVRVLMGWFGLFTLLNVIGATRDASFDANLWWIDLRPLPNLLIQVLLTGVGAILLDQAFRPARSGWRWQGALGGLGLLVVVGLANSIAFYRGWSAGSFDPGMPIPLSLVVALVLALLWLFVWRSGRPEATRAGMAGAADAEVDESPEEQSQQRRLSRPVQVLTVIVVSGLFLVGFPLAQMAFFGTTDYRRQADAIVVLGAKVHEGGVASISLNDRMTTAIELYDQGLAPLLIVSGGRGESGDNEAEVMRDLAVAAGVPEEAVLLDPDGVSTDATITNTSALFDERGIHDVLVVSHFYHLPRIQLGYQAQGYDVLTVPSQSTPIPQTTMITAREVPAFWVYYLRAALS